MVILSKGCKRFESDISLKLSFTNIQVLCPTFVESKFFLESNSPDILAVFEKNLDDSFNSGNLFSVNPKGCCLVCMLLHFM